MMARAVGIFATGTSSRWSSRASCRFASASGTVSPWLATSISKHWATYQSPSRVMEAVNCMMPVYHGPRRARPASVAKLAPIGFPVRALK
jgi:hypothetical protein